MTEKEYRTGPGRELDVVFAEKVIGLVKGTEGDWVDGGHVRMSKEMNSLSCDHCKDSYEINLPAPIYVFSAILNIWLEHHRRCKVKK